MQPSRYHIALRILHWLTAVMLLVALVMGTLVLDKTPNTSPEKMDALRGHMVFGGLILVLTLIRLVVRLRTEHPAPVVTGMAFADRLAVCPGDRDGCQRHWNLHPRRPAGHCVWWTGCIADRFQELSPAVGPRHCCQAIDAGHCVACWGRAVPPTGAQGPFAFPHGVWEINGLPRRLSFFPEAA